MWSPLPGSVEVIEAEQSPQAASSPEGWRTEPSGVHGEILELRVTRMEKQFLGEAGMEIKCRGDWSSTEPGGGQHQALGSDYDPKKEVETVI